MIWLVHGFIYICQDLNYGLGKHCVMGSLAFNIASRVSDVFMTAIYFYSKLEKDSESMCLEASQLQIGV